MKCMINSTQVVYVTETCDRLCKQVISQEFVGVESRWVGGPTALTFNSLLFSSLLNVSSFCDLMSLMGPASQCPGRFFGHKSNLNRYQADTFQFFCLLVGGGGAVPPP